MSGNVRDVYSLIRIHIVPCIYGRSGTQLNLPAKMNKNKQKKMKNHNQQATQAGRYCTYLVHIPGAHTAHGVHMRTPTTAQQAAYRIHNPRPHAHRMIVLLPFAVLVVWRVLCVVLLLWLVCCAPKGCGATHLPLRKSSCKKQRSTARGVLIALKPCRVI